MGNGDLKYGLQVDPSGGLAGLRAFASRAEKEFGDLALPLMAGLGGAGGVLGSQLADALGMDNPVVSGAMSAAGAAAGTLLGATMAGAMAGAFGQGGAVTQLRNAMTGLWAISGIPVALAAGKRVASSFGKTLVAGVAPLAGDFRRAFAGVAAAMSGAFIAPGAMAPLRRWLANSLVAISMWGDLAVGRMAAISGRMGAALAPLATYAGPALAGLGTALKALGVIAVAAASAIAGAMFAAGAAIVAFAAQANRAWSQVEDGVMRLQAALVGQGMKIADAFSDKVGDKVMAAARDMATALGIPAAETAAGMAVLVKNGMDLEQAMGQMNLVANIATVNQLSMAEASEKLVMAWNGEERALKDLGIRLKSSGNEAEDAAMAMKLLKERYGGGLVKPFIDDNPFKRASAAVNMLWAELGRAFDPSMTALAQKLSDVVLGIVEGLRMSSGEMTTKVEMTLSMLWAFLKGLVDTGAFIANVFQFVAAVVTGALAVVWQSLKSLGSWIADGIMWAVSFVQEQLGKIIAVLGTGLSYIPGLGDKGAGIQQAGESMIASGAAGQSKRERNLQMANADYADTWNAAADTINEQLVDIGEIVWRRAEGGSMMDDLMARGREAREAAEGRLANRAEVPLGEGERVRMDREQRERREAEAAAKEAEKAAQDKQFAANLQRDRNRSVYGAQGGYQAQRNRMTIVLQTPQRMVPALRHGRR